MEYYGLEADDAELLKRMIECRKKEKERLMKDFKEILDMKNREIDAIRQEAQKSKEEELGIYKEKCNALESRIKKMESTLSWKLTKILRVFGSKRHISR